MSDKVWIHCNNCSGQKNHELLFHKKISWSEDIDEDFTLYGEDIYDLFKCCGCDSVVFRHQSSNSENYDPVTGKSVIYTRYYPPPTFRNLPRWIKDFPFIDDIEDSIFGLMHEINVALQNDAPRLATMGIRALLEIIMIDKVGDKGSFSANLKAFQEEGYISKKQKEVIEPILEAAHATMHRAFKPDKKDVVQLMDVTESIIETIYINEDRVKSLAKKIPPRNKKINKGQKKKGRS